MTIIQQFQEKINQILLDQKLEFDHFDIIFFKEKDKQIHFDFDLYYKQVELPRGHQLISVYLNLQT